MPFLQDLLGVSYTEPVQHERSQWTGLVLSHAERIELGGSEWFRLHIKPAAVELQDT